MRDLITVGEGTKRLDSCLVTSATRSLCRKLLRAFMMRTTAASVRCLFRSSVGWSKFVSSGRQFHFVRQW